MGEPLLLLLVAGVGGGESATAFLGTQGDQWDMFLALVGAILAQRTPAGIHDRELRAPERP